MPANPTATATLELNAIDNVTATVKKVTGTVDDLRGAYDKLGTVLKTLSFGLAGGLGLGFFTGMIKGAIESENALYELSLKTGATVETLSALRGVAKASGTDMEQVGTMIQRLTKQMYEFAETGKGKAAQAFEQLGYSQEQVKKSLGDMNAFLPEFARRLLTTGTASEQVAMAQQLMSRSGANSLAFLHQLVETGTLVPNVFYEQARAAHEFEVNLARIEGSSKAAWRSLANDLLPALNKIASAFAEAYKQGGLLSGVIAAIQTTITGDDLYKANKEFSELVDRRGAIQNKIDELRRSGDFATPGAKGDKGPGTLAYWQAQLEATDKQIAAIRNYRAELEAAEDTKRKSAELALKAREGGGGGAESQLLWTPQMEEMFQARRAAWRESEKMTAEEQKLLGELVKAGEKYDASLEARKEHYLDLLDPGRKYIEEQQKVQELVDSGKLSEDDAVRVQRKLLEARTKVEDLGKSSDSVAEATRSIGLSFTSAMDKVVFDSKRGINALDLFRAAALDVVKILYANNVSAPTAAAIQGGLAGLFNGNSASTGTGATSETVGFLPWAKGGVFAGGRVMAFASGGIVNGPTIFPMADGMGLMGEAGPEAVMPLARTPSGELGVRGGGSGGHTFIIDARGADKSGLAQLAAQVQALGGSIELRSVGAIRKYLERRGSRLT